MFHNKKERQQKRKQELNVKHKTHFFSTTPSTSLLNQPYQYSWDTKISSKSKGIVVNISGLKLRSIRQIFDNFEKKTNLVVILDLSENFLVSFPVCLQLKSLKTICLRSNRFVCFTLVNKMGNLTSLNLSSNQLAEFPSKETITFMPQIRKMFMNNNFITDLPINSLVALGKTDLEELNLSFNNLLVIPPQISLLGSLVMLNLSNNDIVELPKEIIRLSLLYLTATSFDVRGNKLVHPHQEIVQYGGMEAVANFFKVHDNEWFPNDVSLDEEQTLFASQSEFALNESFNLDNQLFWANSLKLNVFGCSNDAKNLFVEMFFFVSRMCSSVHFDECFTPAGNQSEKSFAMNCVSIKKKIVNFIDKKHTVLVESLFNKSNEFKVILWKFPCIENFLESCHFLFMAALHVFVLDLTQCVDDYDIHCCLFCWIDFIYSQTRAANILVVVTHEIQSVEYLLLKLNKIDDVLNDFDENFLNESLSHLHSLNKFALRPPYHQESFCYYSSKLITHSNTKSGVIPIFTLDPILNDFFIFFAKLSKSLVPVECTPANDKLLFDSFNFRVSIFLNCGHVSLLSLDLSFRNHSDFFDHDISCVRSVKNQIDDFRSKGSILLTFQDLCDNLKCLGNSSVNSFDQIKQALKFWTSVGEILWFWNEFDDCLQTIDYFESADITASSPDFEKLCTVLFVNPESIADFLNNLFLWNNSSRSSHETKFHSVEENIQFRFGIGGNRFDGVVQWSLVKDIVFLEEGEFCANFSHDRDVLDQTQHLLSCVLVQMCFIIPINENGNNFEGKFPFQHTSVVSVNNLFHNTHFWNTQSLNESIFDFRLDCFSDSRLVREEILKSNDPDPNVLIPVLLTGTTKREKEAQFVHFNFVQSDAIRLEKTILLSGTHPSNLLTRLIAKMYSKSSVCFNDKKWDVFSRSSEFTKLNRCWNNSFLQEFDDCTVWVLLDEGGVDDDGQNLKWNCLKNETELFPFENNCNQKDFLFLLPIRIICFGHLLHVQSVVRALHCHSVFLEKIVRDYSNECKIVSEIHCPICQMKQIEDEECGMIMSNSQDVLSLEVQNLCDCSDLSEAKFCDLYLEWDASHRMFCSRQSCCVKPDFLIELPDKILQHLNTELYYQTVTKYIRGDIIYEKMTHICNTQSCLIETKLSTQFVATCVVFVLPLHLNMSQQKQIDDLFLKSNFGGHSAVVNTGRIISGSKVRNTNNEGFILTSFLPRTSEDLNKYFLIGDSLSGWTSIAKYVSRPEKQVSGLISDAAMLTIRYNIVPVSISSTTDSMNIVLISKFCDPSNNDQLHFSIGPSRKMRVEQVVQVWGFSGLSLNGCNWARIVRTVGECCLISLYSDEHLIGGPVLHEVTGEVLGVVSRHLYKNATQSAFYVATICN